MKKLVIAGIALAAATALPAVAEAAPAYATTNVNLRAGPSTAYPAVNVVGAGNRVEVFGCLETRSWCDVGYAGQRGWMSSDYLADATGPRRYVGPRVVQEIGAPVVTFSVGSYWDNHYRGRAFYRDRGRYAGPGFYHGPRGRGPDRDWGRDRDRGHDRGRDWDRDRDHRGDSRHDDRWDRHSDRRGDDGRRGPPRPLYRVD